MTDSRFSQVIPLVSGTADSDARFSQVIVLVAGEGWVDVATTTLLDYTGTVFAFTIPGSVLVPLISQVGQVFAPAIYQVGPGADITPIDQAWPYTIVAFDQSDDSIHPESQQF